MDAVSRGIARERAIPLLARGDSIASIARQIGVSRQTACAWRRTMTGGGQASHGPCPHSGRPPKAPRDEVNSWLLLHLVTSPEAYGLAVRRWHVRDLTQVLRVEQGVRYSRSRLDGILRGLGRLAEVATALQASEPPPAKLRIAAQATPREGPAVRPTPSKNPRISHPVEALPIIWRGRPPPLRPESEGHRAIRRRSIVMGMMLGGLAVGRVR